MTSSSVARNAFTSVVGRFRMKPTVSLNRTLRREGARRGGPSDREWRTSRIRRDSALGQAIEQGGFARVRIADQRQRGETEQTAAGGVRWSGRAARTSRFVLDLLDRA